MNGGGKTGKLRSDPTGEANLVGHAGNTVRLSVKGPPGVTIAQASYNNGILSLSQDRQQISFVIASGISILVVALGGIVLPGIYSLVEEQNELASFRDKLLTLTIRGELRGE